jgi:hypothetical protein
MTIETRQDFLEDRFWEAVARVQHATTPPLAAAYREAAQRYAIALKRYGSPRLTRAMEDRNG